MYTNGNQRLPHLQNLNIPELPALAGKNVELWPTNRPHTAIKRQGVKPSEIQSVTKGRLL